MKQIVAVLGLCFTSISFSSTLNLEAGTRYVGVEEINGHKSGEKCLVDIQSVKKTTYGLHCYEIEMKVFHSRLKNPGTFKLLSRVTNGDSPKYDYFKTCAYTLTDDVPADAIYSTDTTHLITDLFTGGHSKGWTSYDYFLAISYKDKSPASTTITKTSLLTEFTYDCVKLTKTKKR